MSSKVKLNDVVEAIDSAMEEHVHYLDKRTGEIILLTSEELTAAEDDDPISDHPDWQRDSILKAREVLSNHESFSQLPDQVDIHEYQMMEDFCFAIEDRQVGEDLLRKIKGAGAFRRFKNAIYSMSIEKAWHEFKRNEIEKIAIQWLEENEIPYSHDEDVITVSETSM